MRIAVIGDSISSHNNGASAVAWPRLLEDMIRGCGGRHDVEVRNYSVPGLTWKTARTPTEGFKLRGTTDPLAAAKADGFDLLLVMMGVNDRANPNAILDAYMFREKLTGPVHHIWQKMWNDDTGQRLTSPTVVTKPEADAMQATYTAMLQQGWPGMSCDMWKLFSMGMHYDGLHPTDTGKQWIAASIYRYLEPILGLTPITRNIAWLWDQGWTLSGMQWVRYNNVTYDQMLNVSK